MPPYGIPYVFPFNLFDMAFPGQFKLNPTILVGDVLVQKDQGPFVAIANLPTETPPGSGQIYGILTAEERQANITIVKLHSSTFEWGDLSITVRTDDTGAGPTPPDWSGFIGIYDLSLLARENGIPFLQYYPHSMRRTLSREAMAQKLSEIVSVFQA